MIIGRRAALAACLAFCVALAWSSAAGAATVDIKVGGAGAYGDNLSFSPSTVTINVGDAVHFYDAGGQHNVDFTTLGVTCANGCSDQGGNGTPVDSAWAFTRTFNAPGTFPFKCDIHGDMYGMKGSITVVSTAPAGTVAFSQSAYTVSETAGTATITVTRTGGTNGAVGVSYAATAGTAVAGTDFQPASGTLSWANGDGANKTFTVTILNDHTADGSQSVHLALSSPTGGATLGRSSATLSIQDASTGGPPAAPTALVANAQSTTSILLGWHDNASNETAYHVEQQIPPGAFAELAGSPLPANATSLLVPGLTPATLYNYRVRAENAAGLSAFSNIAGASTDAIPGPCVADASTLCVDDQLGDKRFEIRTAFSTSQSGGRSGDGSAIPLASLGVTHGGLFWFFSADNPEMLIKVINGCSLGGSYWVFYAAGTNVGLTTTVIDTVTGHVKTYTNPDRTPASPVQDTAALPCN